MRMARGKTEARVMYPEFKGLTIRKVLSKLLEKEVITKGEYTARTRKDKNPLYLDLDEKVTSCHEYHEYSSDNYDGHYVAIRYGVKTFFYLKVRKSAWITKGDDMKVTELLKITRSITVQSTKGDESKFDGWIVLKPKGKKEFEKALNLDWWFYGSDTAVVKCKTKKESDTVKRLFDCIDGDCTQAEWSSWFREPTDKEWEKYEARMEKKFGKAWQMMEV